MATFPTGFVEHVETIEGGIGQLGDTALARLREKGLSVATGLTEYFAGAIGVMGYQKHIREFCPNDTTESRFGSLESTERWLRKGGGRAMFLLLSGEGKVLEGYGWSGVEPCDELPDHPITSAFRVGERARIYRQGPNFIQTVISGTKALYAPEEGIGLETWEKNRAVNLYYRLGFILLAEGEYELRPALDPEAVDGQVLDHKLFMGYQGSF